MDTHPTDEIDLQELAVRIIQYFKRHFLFILICSVSGIALGFGSYRLLPSIYESKMIFLSDLLTESYGSRIDESLSNLIEEGNLDALSTKLRLTHEDASSIKSINIECIVEVKSLQRNKDETFFIVTVELKDRSILPQLQEGLLNFFRNNEFVKIRTRQREETFKGMIKEIDKELKSVDSLMHRLIHEQSKGETLVLDPSTLFTGSIHLSEQRWEYQNSLELANSIHLLDGFTTFEKPKDPKLLTLTFLGFFLGFIVSIGVLTLKHLLGLAK